MKLPAAELWNKTLPRKFPKIRKNRQHPRPKMKQLPTDCFNKRMIRLLSSDAWAALTAGISTVPIEVVSAEGKRMHGRAIPVNTP